MYKIVKKQICIVALILCATFSANTLADAGEQTAEQIYNKITQNESMIANYAKLAPWLKDDSDQRNIKRSNETSVLKSLLESKANNGDVNAIFYFAMLINTEAISKQVDGEKYQSSTLNEESKNKYDLAMSMFKHAGAAGISAASWNVAVMYANGYGTTTSKLAAIEWYYIAGIVFLISGDREQALAALEAIQTIKKDSDLGKRLEKQLNKGAPK